MVIFIISHSLYFLFLVSGSSILDEHYNIFREDITVRLHGMRVSSYYIFLCFSFIFVYCPAVMAVPFLGG